MICPTCGHEEVPVVEEQPLEATETVAEASVEIARIEADRDVTLAKIGAKSDEGWQEARFAELEGKLQGMREILDRVAPEPPDEVEEPEPVVVVDQDPVPVVEEPEVEAPTLDTTPRTPKRKSAWW